MNRLRKMPNIGEALEYQLLQIGIDSPEKLIERGSKQTWLDIKAIDPSACYNRLCGLQGAIEGIRWHHLSEDTKRELKEFYQSFKL